MSWKMQKLNIHVAERNCVYFKIQNGFVTMSDTFNITHLSFGPLLI